MGDGAAAPGPWPLVSTTLCSPRRGRRRRRSAWRVGVRLRDGRGRGGAGAVTVGLDRVLLAAPADCEVQARAFYGELLGLAELPKPPTLVARGGVWFAVGSAQQLHIGVEAGVVAARKAHPALVVGSPTAVGVRKTRGEGRE